MLPPSLSAPEDHEQVVRGTQAQTQRGNQVGDTDRGPPRETSERAQKRVGTREAPPALRMPHQGPGRGTGNRRQTRVTINVSDRPYVHFKKTITAQQEQALRERKYIPKPPAETTADNINTYNHHGKAFSSDEDGDGPVTSSPRVISKNLNGLQSGNRYKNFLKHINSQSKITQPIAAVLTQEHNLKAVDRAQHQQLAHHFRILVLISYAPSAEERGGTAIFIPYDAIETATPNESTETSRTRVAQTKVSALGGRLTRATIDDNAPLRH